MSIIQGAVRARAPASPISVVFADVKSYSGSVSHINIVHADPGPLLAGDVVIMWFSLVSASIDSFGTGMSNLSGDFQDNGAGRNYESSAWGRRISLPGSLTEEERRVTLFTNLIPWSAQVVTVILRGVRDSVAFLQVDVEPRSYITSVPPATASPLSLARGAANKLALSFGHTEAGTLGGPPPGWSTVIQQSNAAGNAYCEAQYFPANGTTTQLARSPSPDTRAFSIIHLFAP